MRTTLVVPVTVTLSGLSVLSVLKMSSNLAYTKGSSQVNVHARKAMQEKNVIAANLVTRLIQPASAVSVVGLGV